MGDDLRFVYRHFPLTHEHDFAQGAAEATEAAAEQGTFWPFHDLLFAHQDALMQVDLVAYAGQLGLNAGQLGLNAEQIGQALDSGAFRERVQAIKSGGERSGVSGTPTFFINGRRYSGEATLDALHAAVRATVRREAR